MLAFCRSGTRSCNLWALARARTGDSPDELLRVAPEYVAAYQQAGQTLQRLGRDAEAGELLRLGIQMALKQNNEHAAAEMQELLVSLG